MRLLHVIDGAGAGGPGRDEGLTFAACAAAIRHAPGEHRVLVVGGSALRERAEAVSPGCAWVPAPLGKSLLATRGVRRVILDREPHVAVAWSLTATAAVRRAVPSTRRVALIADGAGLVGPGVRALAGTPCGVVGGALRDELVAAGVPRERIAVLPPPGSAEDRRDGTRETLGLAPGEFALAHLGAGVYAGAMRFVFTAALLAEAGCRLTALVRRDLADSDRALAFFAGSLRRMRVLEVSGDVVPAADLALYEGGGHGPMHPGRERAAAATPHLARALSRGVPTVAPAWAVSALDLPAQLRESCASLNALPTELARVALPLVTDAQARLALRASAVRWSARACGDERFAHAASGLWSQAPREP